MKKSKRRLTSEELTAKIEREVGKPDGEAVMLDMLRNASPRILELEREERRSFHLAHFTFVGAIA